MNDVMSSRPEMRIGNARVATADQTLALILDVFRAAEGERNDHEDAIGDQANRRGIAQALKALRQADSLVVLRLNEPRKPLPQLIRTVASIDAPVAYFESISEKTDTPSASGRLVFHLFSALAKFDCSLICERPRDGLQAARRRCTKGRPKPVLDATVVRSGATS